MNDNIFSGQTALVTGGARGIGRSICKMLAAHGAQVAVNYERNEQAALETLEWIKDSLVDAMIVQADVANEEQVRRMTTAIRKRLGSIDLLLNNTGIANNTPHDELAFADWKRMIEVNVDGPFLTIWAVKDEIISWHDGRIVNISSLAGIKTRVA